MGKHRKQAEVAPVWQRLLGAPLSILGAVVSFVGAAMMPDGYIRLPYTGAYIPLVVYSVGIVLVLCGVGVQSWLTRKDAVKRPVLGAVVCFLSVIAAGAALTAGAVMAMP